MMQINDTPAIGDVNPEMQIEKQQENLNKTYFIQIFPTYTFLS